MEHEISKPASKGSWVPVDPNTAREHMNKLRNKIKLKKGALKAGKEHKLHPVMREFKDLINNDSIVRMNFKRMIDQVPGYYREKNNEGEYENGFYLKSIEEMIELINEILTTAPEYNDTELVGFPINTILNWTMGVPAGAEAFRNEKVNAMFRKILAVWTKFLDSPASTYTLVDKLPDGSKGWMCPEARAKLNMEQYIYKPSAPHWGFKSWNKFFIRRFRRGVRPIDGEGDNKAIVSACDSGVYKIQFNTKLQDWFWVKSQPYSLWDMLANEDGDKKARSDKEHFKHYVQPFKDGTVFQAFLSAFKYHRWHSPVKGTIKKAYVKDGTYYSATQAEGMDQGSPNDSQGYIAHTATRALIYIKADDPEIGLMCVILIGMAEVSSCIIDKKIKPGYKIKKGEELGYFQFGGSTHCLVFRKGAINKFKAKVGDNIDMGQLIAIAK